MSELNIYKASAGAGKTFALTMEYFKIIFALRHADSGESRRFSDMFKAGGVGKGYDVVFI